VEQNGSQYIILLKQLGLILVLYSLTRLVFFWLNFAWFEEVDNGLVFSAFFRGLTFDISAILYTNLLVILLSILPFRFVAHKACQRTIKVIFLLVNGIALLANLIDAEYVRFTGRRSDIHSLDIMNDILRQAGQLAANYWGITILFIVLMTLLFFFTPTMKEPKYRLKLLPAIAIFLLFGGSVFLGIRGGLGKYPISPVKAFEKGSKHELGLLTINTPFNMIMSLGKKTLKEYYFMPDEQLDTYLSDAYHQVDSLPDERQNVVVIILESFSAGFSQHLNPEANYTPNLDSIAREGQFFKYAFANGRTSAEAISTILTGVPSLFKGSLSRSVYQSNQFYSLFNQLKEEGYQTGFYHGGFNGTMQFDQWSSKMGIPYFGMNEYPEAERDFDGNWGVFDEPYLQYFAQQLDTLREPFASAVFTLSSHQPFTLPEGFEDTFTPGDLPVYESIQYTDYALGQFFATARQMDWFDRTLFIITADHIFPGLKKYGRWIDLYHIPMVLYHPGQELKIDSTQIVEQLDIPVSIADYLGLEAGPFPRLGRSFFETIPKDKQDAILYLEPYSYLIKDGYMIEFNGNDQFIPYNWNRNSLPDSVMSSQDVEHFKAYLQYYNHQLIHNRFLTK
jgi:phosphoglycerol transferase MdoB-like AlkP superfamily enzyme